MNERARFFVVLLIIIINTTVFAQEELCPSAMPSRMAIGMGGITLPPTPTNLRSGPSTETQKVMEMPVGTIFTVIEGPECSSTYTWWNIELIDGAQGWVAEGLDGEYWIAPYQQESDPSPESDLSILILGHWIGEEGQAYADPTSSYTFFEDGTMEYRGPNNSLRGTYWWRDSNTIEFEGVWTDHNGDQYPVGPGVYTVNISGDRLILSSTDGRMSMSFRRSEIVSFGSGNLQPESIADCSDAMPPRLSLGAAHVTEGIALWQAPSEESEIVVMVAHWGRETETEVQVLQGPVCSEGMYWYEVGIGGQTGWTMESIGEHYLLVQILVEPAPITVTPIVQTSSEWPLLQYGDIYQGYIYRMVDTIGTTEGCDFLRFTGTEGDQISVSVEVLSPELVPSIFFEDVSANNGRYLDDTPAIITLENTGWYWLVICVPETGVAENGEYRLTLNEGIPPEETSESTQEYVTRTLDRGEYQRDLIFDPENCILVNGADLVVLEIQNTRELVDEILLWPSKVQFLWEYLKENDGSVEILRQVVRNEMYSINPDCINGNPERFRYQIGTILMDSSGLGNIAFGYFSTYLGLVDVVQEQWGQFTQRFNTQTRVEIQQQCGDDRLCFWVRFTIVGDNPDDQNQIEIGQDLARAEILSVRSLEAIVNQLNQ